MGKYHPGAKVWLLAVNMLSAGLMIMSSLTSDYT